MTSSTGYSRFLGAALAACQLAVSGVCSGQEAQAAAASSTAALSERELAWHVLSRLGFGPRPGDVEKILELGVDPYIEKQLLLVGRPEPQLDARLSALGSLGLGPAELARAFPFDKQERKAAKEQRKQDKAEGKSSPRERPQEPGELDPLKRLVGELAMGRMLRSVYSEHQLEQVLVDFWFNHFNVFARKGRFMPYLLGAHEQALREHAVGRFEDLLIASAESPAMLYYLDNWLSVGESAAAELRSRQGKGRGRRGFGLGAEKQRKAKRFLKEAKGLNENYARELLELHTLGVDGGYTQEDVQEVARCFTGWGLRKPDEGSVFVYRKELHDDGAKRVLGHVIPAGGGRSDGLQVLRILARHPATARHVCQKLAVRFVSDEPPATLVDAMSRRYLQTNGDIREVLRLLFASEELRSRAAFQAKVKTPLEFLVSALRASGAKPGPEDRLLLKALHEMNQPLYLCQPPTGYSQLASAWTSAGAMLVRMNLATRMASGRVDGLEMQLPENASVPEVARRLLGFDPAPGVLRTIEDAVSGRRAEQMAAALVIGGPDFQRR